MLDGLRIKMQCHSIVLGMAAACWILMLNRMLGLHLQIASEGTMKRNLRPLLAKVLVAFRQNLCCTITAQINLMI